MNLHICEFAYLSYVQKYDTIIDSNLNIIVCKVAVTLLNRVCGLNMECRWDRYSLHTELFYIKNLDRGTHKSNSIKIISYDVIVVLIRTSCFYC